MKTTRKQNLFAAAIVGVLELTNAHARNFSPEKLQRRTLERRAFDAAIRGVPIVSFEVMRQAFFRDAKAGYNDIMYWSSPQNWKCQGITPNNSTRYCVFFANTKSGPVVFEIPPAGQEANWIPTVAGKGWFPYFRFYGPDKPVFDRSWVLPDFEKVK